MKLSLILLLVTLLNVSASIYSQSFRFTLNLKQVTIKNALAELEKNSSFKFIYRNDVINDEQVVSLNIQDEPLEEVFPQLFDPNQFTFKIFEGNIVVITDKNLQQQKIKGKITDFSTGEPLPGVNILVQGTTVGVTSDIDGNYSIDVPSMDVTLVFSYVGYVNETVPVSGKSVIDMQLVPDVKKLEEVVVVGYGTQKRSDVTGSVTTVSKARLSQLPVTNIIHALEGSTAGLQITQNSTVPGSTGSLQIRGLNSVSATTLPLIILDGIPFNGSTNDINPNDIESVQVLKDASAVAIYGTRGSNGVIIMTTKKGARGSKPNIIYNGVYGIESMSHVLKPMSPQQHLQKYYDYMLQNGLSRTDTLPYASEVENFNKGITTDWLKEVEQPGRYQEHTIGITGGTDNVQYYLSGNHLEQQGVIKGYQYKRTSFRTNLDAKINDYIRVGTSSFITHNNYDGGRVNFLEANAMSPYSVPRDANGNYIIYPMAPEQLFLNPLLGLTVTRLDRSLNLTGNGYFEFTPSFLIKGLKYRLNAAYTYNTARTDQYAGRADNDLSGTADLSSTINTQWVIENILTYDLNLDKHHFDLTLLYSSQKEEYFKTTSQAKGFTNDALAYYDLLAGATKTNDSEGNEKTMLSQMGRLNYSYDSKYLFTVTARRDGSSVFGVNTSKYGVFPSVALGWNISRENFMANLSDKINNLKLRLSYGTTGNEAIAINQTKSYANAVQYPFGGTAVSGVLYNNLGNGDLHWESTTSANGALDFGVLDNRISGTLEVYKTKTRDILLNRQLPGVTGYNNVIVNLGKMQNVGLEITLKTVNLKTNDFSWETDLNFSTYRNKVLELYGDGKDDKGNNWFIGKPLHVIYDYQKIGIWQTGEDASKSDPGSIPGDLKFKDQLTIDTNGDLVPDSADGKITADDKVIVGQRDPKWVGGITNTVRYKNFTFSIFLQISQGGIRSNHDLTYADEAWRRNLPADFKYWTAENNDNYWPSLAAYKKYRGYQFAEDYSYVRIKDITLSYVIPKDLLAKAKINGLTVFISGRNLYTFTKWFGWDPELSYDSRGSGNWRNNYPPVRTISIGANLSL